MSDFAQAWLAAEADLLAPGQRMNARRRVAARIDARDVKPRSQLVLAYAAGAALCLAGGYLVQHMISDDHGTTPSPEPNSAPAIAGSANAAPTAQIKEGLLIVTVSRGECRLSIDGKSFGVGSEWRERVPVGRHSVTCEADGRSRTEIVFVREADPHMVRFAREDGDGDPAERGTVVAIAIGGSCHFELDGEPIGVKSSFRRKVPEGVHVVTCTSDGRRRSQSVEVRSAKPGIASFRLDSGSESTPELPRPFPRPKDPGF